MAPPTPRPPRARRRALGALPVVALAPLSLVLFGFGLDRGELDCEKAVAHLVTCCPDLPADRVGCIQEGGCEREQDGTLMSEAESECLASASCAEVEAKGLCQALLQRNADLLDPEGPTLAELQEGDPLCE